MDSSSLKPVAVVTGAAHGIGRATARALLDAGYAVVLADLDADRGRDAEATLAERGPAAFIACDVAQPDQIEHMVDQALERFGRIDALVNNAGIGYHATLAELTLDEWNRVLATNLTAAFLCTQACLPQLNQRRGAVVNIASTRALQSEADGEAYAASKGGLIALTHAMAVSLGPAVRVNCISPGWINVSDKPSDAFDARHHDQHPAGRIGEPDDIARLVVYLLSDAAGFITGANHVVDGGMTHKMIYE